MTVAGFCPNCGAARNAGAFCSSCGTRYDAAGWVQATPAGPAPAVTGNGWAQQQKSGPGFLGRLARAVLGLILLFVALSVLGGLLRPGSGNGAGAPEATPRGVTSTQRPAATVRPASTVDALSPLQRNALEKAQEYLDYTAFSASGLVAQLEYEGFEKAVSQEAVASLDVDWKEQAYQKALEYLDYTSFSLSGLIDQLEYEGFTAAEAKYGARKAYGE
jgi:hypothetical protein